MSLYKLQKCKPPVRSLESSPSMTKQSFKDECDVNRIMSKYQATGVLDHIKHMDDNGLAYGDFSDGFDFRESCDRVIAAENMFLTLPSSIRSRFMNNPAQFLDFVSNPENLSEMKKMGLVKSSELVNDSSEFVNDSSNEEINKEDIKED